MILTPLASFANQLLRMRCSKIQELRFLFLEDWFLEPRPTSQGRFWTAMQTSFMRAIQDGSVKFCVHHRITVEGMAKSIGDTEEEMRGHLTYMAGLLDLLARSQEYVVD